MSVNPKTRQRAAHMLRAVRLRKEAGLCIAYKSYADAIALLKEAHPLFRESLKDQHRCVNQIAYCRKRLCGIDDWRFLDLGIWYGSERISEREMRDMLRTKTSTGSKRRSRSSGHVTIKSVVFDAMEEHGEDNVTLDMVLPLVLAANPSSVFDEAHLKFYKSKYRNKARKG